jgi:hypothetical protein
LLPSGGASFPQQQPYDQDNHNNDCDFVNPRNVAALLQRGGSICGASSRPF